MKRSKKEVKVAAPSKSKSAILPISKSKDTKKELVKAPPAATAATAAAAVELEPATALDITLSRKAIAALFTYEAKRQDTATPKLIDDYAKPIIAQVQLIQAITKPVVRPVRVAIPYSMFSAERESHSVCFFCRTEDKEKLDGYFKAYPFSGLGDIISITQVRKLYAAYKDRKKLLSEHTHFACDARVMTQLYNLLGKTFGSKNNYPIPIEFETNAKLPAALQKSLDSTYMHLAGSSISIRIGLTSMNPNDVVQNLLHGIEFAVQKFKNGWKNVQNVHVKISDSPALPVYNKVGSKVIEYVKNIGSGNSSITESKASISSSEKKKELPIKKSEPNKNKRAIAAVEDEEVEISLAAAPSKKKIKVTKK